ncbi:HRDC-like protein [Piptocephalis cylindrospora]|uniref:HRDC-like protein n=1 Tax=Piptocephalis cylindrospora TaxID=1907219 RepID=A0A4P9Y6N3_9FUNG|nr:HRDC-like protein [Piptocephalis cylindrospora]|eukprot:RKP14717.1 HRDC-like protein [Piptocephalis cylindrospora]
MSAFSNPINPPKRRAGPAKDDPDASTLSLGEDFQTAPCLSVSELRELLNRERDSKASKGEPLTEVFLKTLNHTEKFAIFKNENAIHGAKLSMQGLGISEFERAQLLNLCCKHTDEAKALVPSLIQSTDDDNLADSLMEIVNVRDTQR